MYSFGLSKPTRTKLQARSAGHICLGYFVHDGFTDISVYHLQVSSNQGNQNNFGFSLFSIDTNRRHPFGIVKFSATQSAYLFQLFVLVLMYTSRSIVYRNAPDFVYTPVLNYNDDLGYNFVVDFDEKTSLGECFVL